MDADWWLGLDRALGYVEVVGVLASLGWLAVILVSPSSRRAWPAFLLAAILALTVAQPLGVKAKPISAARFASAHPTVASTEAIHTMKVADVSLISFKPYTRKIFYFNGDSSDPSTWLKIRSWLRPGLFTNGLKATKLCGGGETVCWVPEGQHSTGAGNGGLQLYRSGNDWYYRVLGSDGQPLPEKFGYEHSYYRLTFGIASWWGLAYWLVAPMLCAIVWWRRRSTPVASTGAEIAPTPQHSLGADPDEHRFEPPASASSTAPAPASAPGRPAIDSIVPRHRGAR